MTRANEPRRRMPPARRAGVLLLVLAALAGVMGVVMIAGARTLIEAAPTPQLQERLDELRRQLPIDLRVVAVAVGVMMLVYASVAATLGVLVRGGGRTTAIVTLVLAAVVAGLSAIQAGAAVLLGVGGDAVLSVGAAVAHGVIVKWMIQTLARSPMTAALPRPSARKPPLADYYLPPTPPVPQG